MLVEVVLRGLADAVGTALEIDLFAKDVAGVVGWHQGRVQHREAGGGDPADVVDCVAEFRPQQRVVSQFPIDAAVGLPAILIRDRGDLGAEVEAAQGVVVGQLLKQPAVGGATRIGHDAPQGRHIETAGIAEAAGGGAPPIHLAQAQDVALEIAGRQQHGAVVAQPGPEHPVHIDILLGTVVGAGPVLGLELGTFIAAPGDEVDHAGDGVGAINGGGAVFQDLDPLDGQGRRQGGNIDEAGAIVSGHRRKHLAPAVQQHQSGRHPQTPQVEIGGAGAEILRQVVGVVLSAGVDGQGLHQIPKIFHGAVLQILDSIGDKGRGQIALLLDAAAGARHHHQLLFNHFRRRGASRRQTSAQNQGATDKMFFHN